MKIYFSVLDAIEDIKKYYSNDEEQGLVEYTGWGSDVLGIHKCIQEHGKDYDMYLADSPEDADIEFCTSQPPFKMYPHMQPNVYYTMNETSGLPDMWIEPLNTWDLCITPSAWGVKSIQNDLDIPVKLSPYLMPVDKFPYFERDINGTWNYLTMAISLQDRKNAKIVGDIFLSGGMPSDAYLCIKLVPIKGQPSFAGQHTEQVYIVSEKFPLDYLIENMLKCSHVSVNPSRGEGFGKLAREHSLTGMLSIVSNYSGYADMKHVLKISGIEEPTPYLLYNGCDFNPDEESVYENMIWSYEHREQSMKIGKNASDYIRRKYSYREYLPELRKILESVNTEKKISEVPKINFSTEWIDNHVKI